MNKLIILTASIIVLVCLLGSSIVSAYYAYPVYPTRNYYMMDYYSYPAAQGYYYNPYSYAYSGYGWYGNYYHDPNWKYYTLNTFMQGNRYGSY